MVAYAGMRAIVERVLVPATIHIVEPNRNRVGEKERGRDLVERVLVHDCLARRVAELATHHRRVVVVPAVMAHRPPFTVDVDPYIAFRIGIPSR